MTLWASTMQLPYLDPLYPEQSFPPLESALNEPNGLIAIGGCLSVPRILNAYRSGIFPWFGPEEPILWWSPDPRLVLYPSELIISRSLKKTIRQQVFELSFDQVFPEVMRQCAAPRANEDGTWITNDMFNAYNRLHDLGYAHSIEAWQNGKLAGGLYGIAIGKVFFGESMFHKQSNASKVAFCYLVSLLKNWGFEMIDCQVHTNHLASLGAQEISRQHFLTLITRLCAHSPSTHAWTLA